MAFRFLHAADIHLDSPLLGLRRYPDAPVDRVQSASRRAFARLVDLALDRKVDFVVIAGDLYDGDWKDFHTGIFLVNQLARLEASRIPVVVIAGNHDAQNHMTRSLRWPTNATQLSADRPETHRIDDLNVAIHGQSFARRDIRDNLAASYPDGEPGWFNIGLLHTCLSGADGHESYSPCKPDDLRRLGYDYWALGHVHGRASHGKDVPVEFPGNLQGRHARETGPKGCLLVDVDGAGQSTMQFERLDTVCWRQITIDATELDSDVDLYDCWLQRVMSLVADEPEDDRLIAARAVILGSSPLNNVIRGAPDVVESEFRTTAHRAARGRFWLEKVEIRTKPPAQAVAGDGPLAELAEILDELRDNPALLLEMAGELKDLKNRAEPEFRAFPDAPSLGDAPWLSERLKEVGPLLTRLFRNAERGVS